MPILTINTNVAKSSVKSDVIDKLSNIVSAQLSKPSSVCYLN